MLKSMINPDLSEKKAILLIQAALLFLALTDAYSQWYPQTSGTTSDLHAVSFTDANTGTAVGSWFSCIILRTTNGGTNWTSQTSGTTNTLWSVSFTDANTGTAVGSSGYPPPYDVTIIRTTNGGVNWISQTSGTTNALLGVSFTDANTGTAVGYVGTIVRTTNGGTTYPSWFSQTSGTTNMLLGVCFTDANTGTVVGYGGIILRTTNGGTTWFSQTSGTTYTLWGVSFIDANNGTAVGKYGTILRTTNGGGLPPITAAPLLISPVNNAIGQGLNLSLVWNSVEFASTYRVQLASDSSFSNIILDDSTLTDTMKAVTNLSTLTYYYWRVNAKNISGTGPFSSV